MKAQLNKRDCEVNNTAKFLDIVRKYSEITELTVPILNDLIDSIIVYNAEGRSRNNRKQKIEVTCKFIGVMQTVERQTA